jgi:hypothetical protein
MPVPEISDVSLEALVETLIQILRAMDTEFCGLLKTVLSIPGIECLRFRHLVVRIRMCGDASAKLAAIGMDIVTLTNAAVEQADLRRCLVTSRRPAEVRTVDCLIPAVSSVFLKSKLVQAMSNALWAISPIPMFLVIYDATSDHEWWLAVLPFLSIPGVVFVASCLNRKVVKKLVTTFQPTSNPPFQPLYILFWILVMFCCLAALWRNHPAKIVALSAWLPTFVIAPLVDAYPEAGRTFTSRYEQTSAAGRYSLRDCTSALPPLVPRFCG